MPLEETNLTIEPKYTSPDLQRKLAVIFFEDKSLIDKFNAIAVRKNQVINEEIINYLNNWFKDFKREHPNLMQRHFYKYLIPALKNLKNHPVEAFFSTLASISGPASAAGLIYFNFMPWFFAPTQIAGTVNAIVMPAIFKYLADYGVCFNSEEIKIILRNIQILSVLGNISGDGITVAYNYTANIDRHGSDWFQNVFWNNISMFFTIGGLIDKVNTGLNFVYIDPEKNQRAAKAKQYLQTALFLGTATSVYYAISEIWTLVVAGEQDEQLRQQKLATICVSLFGLTKPVVQIGVNIFSSLWSYGQEKIKWLSSCLNTEQVKEVVDEESNCLEANKNEPFFQVLEDEFLITREIEEVLEKALGINNSGYSNQSGNSVIKKCLTENI
ncbi:hypothetical protein [Spiroplasma eriocheiris]|uniref:Uncharacterized protein n=1 Tax=Spiroplasma eriocheiris TaxID=315358 RepID=A0A0H3XL77_9MOLU|nr:hypothetical protein [Spiroplasma eriocheiris]AHF57781.1 hypothetical protein SPE_0653 [Spiroplasma eriocheiris CCTCC M 207170]AKM54229.1 hypothetical protein SERIO_v1c06610 [Spiroplasma eriocheiris]